MTEALKLATSIDCAIDAFTSNKETVPIREQIALINLIMRDAFRLAQLVKEHDLQQSA
jgi:hypothetical protein